MVTVPLAQPRVVVLDGEVRIVDLVETDPHVQRVLAKAEDPEEATHSILRIGAQATVIAGTGLETQVVEHRFQGLARSFDHHEHGHVGPHRGRGARHRRRSRPGRGRRPACDAAGQLAAPAAEAQATVLAVRTLQALAGCALAGDRAGARAALAGRRRS